MESTVSALRERAEMEKNNLRHPVHAKLTNASRTLAQREADLSKFYSENPPMVQRGPEGVVVRAIFS